MPRVADLKIEIFADGADLKGILDLCQNPLIKGFTTNPTLMRKADVDDYETFAREVLSVIGGKPISFEVFADDFSEMESQAMQIASWGENINVKIPVTNTRGESTADLVQRLAGKRVSLNVTALMTVEQVKTVADCLAEGRSSYISLFAGRVADTGRDPVPMMAEAVEYVRRYPHLKLIWASPRELLNIFQADAIGCHVITVTHDVLAKLKLVDKDLDEYSLETVQMFYNDARKVGFKLNEARAVAKSVAGF